MLDSGSERAEIDAPDERTGMWDMAWEKSALLEDADVGTELRYTGWETSRTETDAPDVGTILRDMAWDRSVMPQDADEGTGVWYSGSR